MNSNASVANEVFSIGALNVVQLMTVFKNPSASVTNVKYCTPTPSTIAIPQYQYLCKVPKYETESEGNDLFFTNHWEIHFLFRGTVCSAAPPVQLLAQHFVCVWLGSTLSAAYHSSGHMTTQATIVNRWVS